MRLFLAGIMQGSHRSAALHDQHYRGRLKQLLAEHLPAAEVYDPLADHAGSLEYGDEQAREVFLRHCQLCGEVDVVLAFIPEASMGTAIEMWEAVRHARAVISISPLVHNWVVKFVSHYNYADEESFLAALASGEVAARIGKILQGE